jgi:hypothetical protein
VGSTSGLERTYAEVVEKLLFCALVVTLALGISIEVGSSARSSNATRLASARSFALAIGDGTLSGNLSKRYAPFDLVVVDGESARARDVTTIQRASDGLVFAYLDVGTIESYRGWYNAAKRYRPEYWDDWDEWYANVNAPGFRSLLLKRVAPAMLAKGFDGLFLDNTDMTETHPAQKREMRALVAALSRLAHARGKLLFAQNGAGVNWPLRRFYDRMNFEDVSFRYDLDRQDYTRNSRSAVARAQRNIRRFRRAGLKVTATDYVPAGDVADTRIAVRNACAADALPYVSDIGLERIPSRPLVCS